MLMNEKPTILVVDDDQDIRDLLAQYLSRNEYTVMTAADGEEMYRCLSERAVDLVILDVMLPKEDGLTLCRNLRAAPMYEALPIIMLTARGDDFDRIVGLEMGADDYLPKPFNPRELLARIKTVLRRSHLVQSKIAEDRVHLVQFDQWILDFDRRELLKVSGEQVPISSGEFRLLKVFVEHAQRVLNRDQIMDLWHGRENEPFDRSIDVQISRLRQKLGDDAREPRLIKTVRGEGYLLACEVANVSVRPEMD